MAKEAEKQLEYFIMICGKAVHLDRETYNLICDNPVAMTIFENINSIYDEDKQDIEKEIGSKSN